MRRVSHNLVRAAACAVVVGIFTTAPPSMASPSTRVTFPASNSDRTPITAVVLRPLTAPKGPAPAVIAMHGCGGLFAKRDRTNLSARHADWAARWTAAGYVVVFPDSFGSRGLSEVCTTKDRSITPRMRADDALGAAAWLATQADVDRSRMALVGWSNGAGTVLRANDQRLAPDIDVRTVIAFYPGCRVVAERGTWRPRRPTTILIGAADDWTPAAPCEQLAKASGAQIIVYPDAYHDFDSPNAPLRRRTGLAFTAAGNGIAHTGTNQAARAAAIADVTRMLAEAFR